MPTDPANPIGQAIDAIGRDDFARAVALLRPMAANGDLEAAACLGWALTAGFREEDAVAEGLRILEEAAAAGNGAAAHNLGHLFLAGGPGVTADMTRSRQWFRRAEHLGFKPGTIGMVDILNDQSEGDDD